MGLGTRTRMDPMDCSDFLERYSDYDDSMMPSAEAERFREHMAVCPVCTRYDRVLRKGRMLARQLPTVEPSGDFVPRLHMRLWQERDRPSERWGRSRPVLAALPVLTLLLVAAAAAVLLGDGMSGTLTQSTEPPAAAGSTWSAASGSASASAPASSGRVVSLSSVVLAMGPAEARAWGLERVDRAASSSYSPLTMGLPAYRREQPRTRAPLSTHPTLD